MTKVAINGLGRIMVYCGKLGTGTKKIAQKFKLRTNFKCDRGRHAQKVMTIAYSSQGITARE